MGDGRDEHDLLRKKAEFIDSFLRKGAEFMSEMLEENEKLRRRVIQLEQQSENRSRQPSQTTIEELVEKIHELEAERKAQQQRYAEVASVESRLGERYAEIERENSDLASLYVAQSQLTSSLELREVLQVLIEILLNFVGADSLAVLIDDGTGALQPLATEGLDPAKLPPLHRDSGVIGASMKSARPHWEEAIGPRRIPSVDPFVSIPLRHGAECFGAVAVWGFLQQKDALIDIDHRIFNMLADAGGRALEATRLAARARAGDAPEHEGAGEGASFQEYAALLR